MVWLPTASAAVEQVATPLPFTTCALQPPMLRPLSLKTTVPVGVPLPGALTITVAVKVTDWPKTAWFTEEVIAVLVLALFTVMSTLPLPDVWTLLGTVAAV